MDKVILLKEAEILCDRLEEELWASTITGDAEKHSRLEKVYAKALDRNIRRYDGLIRRTDEVNASASVWCEQNDS